MNWIDYLIVVIPSAVAFILAVVAFVLKMKKDDLQGISKEASELLLAIVEGVKDGKLTQEELLKIIQEGSDVIDEARKLLESSK
jgi:hypothetical protein